MRTLGIWTLALAALMTTVGCSSGEDTVESDDSNLEAERTTLQDLDGRTFFYSAWAPGAIFAGGQCYEKVTTHVIPGETTKGAFEYERVTCDHGGYRKAKGEFELSATFFLGTPTITLSTVKEGSLPETPTFKVIRQEGADPYLVSGDGEELRSKRPN